MLNQVVLVGRLTKDVEVTELEKGKKVSYVVLAVQRPFKNTDGLYQTDFIRCIMWNVIAQNAKEYCQVGDVVGILLLVMQYFLLISLDSFRYQTSFQIVNFCYL